MTDVKPIFSNEIFIPPQIAIVARGLRCGIVKGHVECPVTGPVAVGTGITVEIWHAKNKETDSGKNTFDTGDKKRTPNNRTHGIRESG